MSRQLNEIVRMQKLAGILKENEESSGNYIREQNYLKDLSDPKHFQNTQMDIYSKNKYKGLTHQKFKDFIYDAIVKIDVDDYYSDVSVYSGDKNKEQQLIEKIAAEAQKEINMQYPGIKIKGEQLYNDYNRYYIANHGEGIPFYEVEIHLDVYN
jgi:hypothetical protein